MKTWQIEMKIWLRMKDIGGKSCKVLWKYYTKWNASFMISVACVAKERLLLPGHFKPIARKKH